MRNCLFMYPTKLLRLLSSTYTLFTTHSLNKKPSLGLLFLQIFIFSAIELLAFKLYTHIKELLQQIQHEMHRVMLYSLFIDQQTLQQPFQTYNIRISHRMQKTMLFGKQPQTDSVNTQHNTKVVCHSCLKLQTQLDDINFSLTQKQQQIQNVINGLQNQAIKIVQQELISLNQKYASLKKKVKQLQKESDDLFSENTLLQKQLNAYKNQLKQQSSKQKTYEVPQNDLRKQAEPKQKDTKQLQEKVKQLETITQSQNEQIMKLKQHIKKRNRLQEERHKMISLIA